jgi:hypothetical protein
MRPGLTGPRIGLRFATGAIVYVIVGYPIAAAALSILRPRPVARGDGTPTVSVIIACHNEVDVIGSKLANLCAIDYPSDLLEIVVVDDGSTDGTAEVAGPLLRGARLHRLPIRGGKAAAVNAGAAVTRGDIIVLSDATALLDSSALRELVRGFTDDEVGVISGRMTHHTTGIGRAIDLYWRYEDMLRSWETASGSTVGVNGNLFAVRRCDFEPLPAETVNDELTIALRVGAAGKRVIFEPRARVVDLPSQSMREEQGRRARMTAGRIQSVFGPARLAQAPEADTPALRRHGWNLRAADAPGDSISSATRSVGGHRVRRGVCCRRGERGRGADAGNEKPTRTAPARDLGPRRHRCRGLDPRLVQIDLEVPGHHLAEACCSGWDAVLGARQRIRSSGRPSGLSNTSSNRASTRRPTSMRRNCNGSSTGSRLMPASVPNAAT